MTRRSPDTRDDLERAYKALVKLWTATGNHLTFQSFESQDTLLRAYDRSAFLCGRIADPDVRAAALHATYECARALSPLAIEPRVTLALREETDAAVERARAAILEHDRALGRGGLRGTLLAALDAADTACAREVEALRAILIALPRLQRDATWYLEDFDVRAPAQRARQLKALQTTAAEVDRAAPDLRSGPLRATVLEAVSRAGGAEGAAGSDEPSRVATHHAIVEAIGRAVVSATARLDALEGRR